MANVLSSAQLTTIYNDYFSILNHPPSIRDEASTIKYNKLMSDLLTLINAYNVDATVGLTIAEPRVTIATYVGESSPFVAVAGSSVNYTVSVTGGIGSATFSAVGLPSGLSINSSTGAITGTAPAITATTFNSTKGNRSAATSQQFSPLISAVNSFGQAVNGPYTFPITIVSNTVPVVSSAATGAGNSSTHAFTTYTITASNTPTSFVAFGLSQLKGITLNAATGAISGTLDAAVVGGTYTIYVAGINASGQGPTKAVVITVS